ncbi:MAG: alkaline phosphatase family protein, partial [Gaiellales bacterium]
HMKSRDLVTLALLVVLTACFSSQSEPSKQAARSTPEATIPSPNTRSGPVFKPDRIEKVTEPADGWLASGCELPQEYVTRIWRGFRPDRSPEIMVVPREPNIIGAFTGQAHSGPWPYLQDVPLVFYGPGFIRATGEIEIDREVTLADIAPTFAELLEVPPPNDIGRPIHDVLVPADERPGRPALIVTVVWDGGGDNVLNAWPDAWPELANLIAKGSAVTNATVGSSPSITPAVHATIGTGAFPKQHGIVGIVQGLGDTTTDSFPDGSPEFMELPTLADTYDQAEGNDAKVGLVAFLNWHLAMMGQGSQYPGGDKDIAAIIAPDESIIHGPDVYSLPEYMTDIEGLEAAVREVDLADGKADNQWMGRSLTELDSRRDSPAWILHQTTLIKNLIRKEGFGKDGTPDLFFTNYKQLDRMGHISNMLSREVRSTLRYTDAELEVLTRFFDRVVGPERWVMVVTADHGQGPLPEVARAWPINQGELLSDLAARFGGTPGQLVTMRTNIGYWFENDYLSSIGATLEQISDFFVNYRLEDNVKDGAEIPAQYRSRGHEPVFSAAFPSDRLPEILKCSG